MDLSQGSFFDIPEEVVFPKGTQVVVVSDFFVSEYTGGAELSTEALLKSSPFHTVRIKSNKVSLDVLKKGQKYFWIFTNFTQMNMNILPSVIVNMKYAIVEYDRKFCKYRSEKRHEIEEGKPCDCPTSQHGKLMQSFYKNAKHIFWMSEQQMSDYHKVFPDLRENKQTVLSSVFDDETFLKIKVLRNKFKNEEKKGWLVLGSNSWIKGYEQSKKYCEENGLEYEVVWGLPYDDLLTKMAKAEGIVALPQDKDSCPRFCIESLLLGGKVICNKNVQNVGEEWCKDMYQVVE